ncbi:MAG TPA: PspC domain-containing protein [Rubrobacteraceae bacterium]|nr:PspC domain-containing protein [Rubrobacteraceae bacterium]
MDIKRARRDRWIFGVCGGIAHTYGWNPNVVRLGAVALTILAPGPGWLLPVVYIVLGFVWPESEEY